MRTETNAIGLDSAFTLTPENDQYFYSLYDSSGSLWDLNNETVTGVFFSRTGPKTQKVKIQMCNLEHRVMQIQF